MNDNLTGNENNILFYDDTEGNTKVEVLLENEDVWLNVQAISSLFNIDRSGVVKHIRNIYKDEELSENSTCAKIAQVQKEGNREALKRKPMTMQDWVTELNSFLTMTKSDVLKSKGAVSHDQALKKAHAEYEKYMQSHLTKAEKDYLEIINLEVKELKNKE